MLRPVTFRDATPADLAKIVPLNNAEIPRVGHLTLDLLKAISDEAFSFRIAEGPKQELAGFFLSLDQNASYASPNFRWFQSRYPKFVYVDRIVVAKEFQGAGLGRGFYEELEAMAVSRYPLMTCEVNLRPANPESIAFHTRIGFREVGQQETENGKKSVSMMIKEIG